MVLRKTLLLVIALSMVAFVLASCDNGSIATPTAVSEQNGTPGNSNATVMVEPGGGDVGNAKPTPTLDVISSWTQLPTVNPSTTITKTKVTIALGFTPDVQFTPFYVALNKGYYAEEGLDVTFKHGVVPDLIRLLAAGDQDINFAVASGDEIIPARLND